MRERLHTGPRPRVAGHAGVARHRRDGSVYILTSQNCDSPNVTIRVPQEFADKASCVSGRVLDRCASTASGVWYESHYTRVSMSHGMIIKHAQESGFAHITVMEEDTVLNDDVGLTPETEKDVLALLVDEFTPETSTLGRVEVATDRDTGARRGRLFVPRSTAPV